MKQKSDTSILTLKGIGKQLAQHFSRLEIYSIQDLLLHFPMRYQNRANLQTIVSLLPAQEAVVMGVIQSIAYPKHGRTKLLCELQDETGVIFLRFFHALSFHKNIFKPGVNLRVFGEMKWGKLGREMFHPEYEVVGEVAAPLPQYLTSIYPATEGLSQQTLRKTITQVFTYLQQGLFFNELLPQYLLQKLSFPLLQEAILFLHQPSLDAAETLATKKNIHQKRIAFEELLAYRLGLLKIKNTFHLQKSFPLKLSTRLSRAFIAALPFQLTSAQMRVVGEIEHDLAKPQPMLRLVQGDVGAGKTIVAALAMLQAIENAYQVAMMAPTALLAEQHARVLSKWFEPLGISIVLLSGQVKNNERKNMLASIKNGKAQVVIGTHALFQQEVVFHNLALVIVDEQHRFGVKQRDLLRDKGVDQAYCPHQLIMTATPIPRTLAMSIYADLDCSVVDELPKGRTPIVTSVMPNEKRDEIIARLKTLCEEGRQAFWVCPLIDESHEINAKSAIHIAQYLQNLLPHLSIGLVHGRMLAQEKESVMREFQQGNIHILVATTVIEVGVDVPNASVIVIENAERLGLAQLHQLRGRVGRGQVASYCILLYQSPLSSIAEERLKVIRETNDGFKIAERDLTLRGPGEIFGNKQAGELVFRVADFIADHDLLPLVREVADTIMREHSEIVEPLIERWLNSFTVINTA
ncbi:MAG: ATP-dependent DNA helicase RecG [Gammaproteobacteria bacterium RIFCSPHIGHO2_12_FULL_38_14]|nr:MAG: ATP-dependent DNA helicase RecG [Gammaproteobacteria bacterium RIFCSPHIGHO2_12_FULL_38_14]